MCSSSSLLLFLFFFSMADLQVALHVALCCVFWGEEGFRIRMAWVWVWIGQDRRWRGSEACAGGCVCGNIV
ncbi:hypothetical protein F4808DRAFT_442639 [Astrocystis sublimbata]|nr:hypothetical protein F4808DRAFT_442639 [Astrocystis sublimbata]